MSYDPSILSSKTYVQTLLSSPSNPTATASTTFVMMGLAIAFTPRTTGRLKITCSGLLTQNTTADGAKLLIAVGTGTAPVNGAALTGTTFGTSFTMTFLTGLLTVPFSKTIITTAFTVGVALWIDLQLAAVTGGSASVTALDFTIEEF